LEQGNCARTGVKGVAYGLGRNIGNTTVIVGQRQPKSMRGVFQLSDHLLRPIFKANSTPVNTTTVVGIAVGTTLIQIAHVAPSSRNCGKGLISR
jgi:hypothetical protein